MVKIKKNKLFELYTDRDFEREVTFPEKALWKKELKELGRHPFWRDYARLIQSPSFRRLKGKTQLFPGHSSDFYRCRLTHSLEVGHIGKSIANSLNVQIKNILKGKTSENSLINLDLIEFSCYAHDLGHPPFGHQGEAILDFEMQEYGGFEGNAQTLRILARIEKKYLLMPESHKVGFRVGFNGKGEDHRAGLGLTFRSLASILKYDSPIIDREKTEDKIPYKYQVLKGYYQSEKKLVEKLRTKLFDGKKIKTVECQIMDIADDIAYSVFDLEDAFKAGFTHPLKLSAVNDNVLNEVVQEVQKKGERLKKEVEDEFQLSKSEKDTIELFIKCDLKTVKSLVNRILFSGVLGIADMSATDILAMSLVIAKNGYDRNEFTTNLVSSFIKSVKIGELNTDNPALTKVYLEPSVALDIEILKRFTYQFQIISPRLKMIEHRGQKIVKGIFDALSKDGGEQFLPSDYGLMFNSIPKEDDKSRKRIICDFISGMTDEYAVTFYQMLYSSTPTSLYKRL